MEKTIAVAHTKQKHTAIGNHQTTMAEKKK
jgi:hypothetical protein